MGEPLKDPIGAAICTAAIWVLAACGPQYAESDNSDSAAGVQDLKFQILTETPTPDPHLGCWITFLSPGQGDALPTSGPVSFSWAFDHSASWSNHWYLEKYVLVVKFPGGNPLAHYDIQNTDTSKTLYMENFQPAGTYTAQISAIGWAPFYEEGSVLCWDEITFSKDAFARKFQKGPAMQPTPCLAGRCP